MHLLLVEDDDRLARALTRLLEEDRHVVEHAPDGRTGLELATGVGGLDCVILDIGLPDMSGLDVARRIRSASVDLSPREFSLLEALLRHPGQVLTRDQLLDHAWPFSVAVTPNAVDAYVHYLRAKLGPASAQLETVRGVGYRLAHD